jgi:hypothetical protein
MKPCQILVIEPQVAGEHDRLLLPEDVNRKNTLQRVWETTQALRMRIEVVAQNLLLPVLFEQQEIRRDHKGVLCEPSIHALKEHDVVVALEPDDEMIALCVFAIQEKPIIQSILADVPEGTQWANLSDFQTGYRELRKTLMMQNIIPIASDDPQMIERVFEHTFDMYREVA